MKELEKYVDTKIKELEELKIKNGKNDFNQGQLYQLGTIQHLLRIGVVGVTLPSIYTGSLNFKRIKEIDTIAPSWNVDKSTVKRLFCDGADWYKKQLKDNGN